MIDAEKFQRACDQVIGREHVRTGIGTLSEKTLHAVLKRYYESDADSHEVPIGPYVADIVGENGIIEVQTAQFNRLRDKLSAFLEVCTVTVVHPVADRRKLGWVDPETGNVVSLQSAPCKDPRADVFLELYRIRELLLHPRLTLCFPLLTIEEYRLLNLKQKNPHHKASRIDKIPTALNSEWVITSREDYRQFLPDGLPSPFTVKEFMKAAHAAEKTARLMINMLIYLGFLHKAGKQGRYLLYEVVQ